MCTINHFYPRSPCGERPTKSDREANNRKISIHALLAESDPPVRDIIQWEGIFLSTLSLRRATLAGPSGPAFLYNFYPRSPCGERRKPRALKSRRIVFLSTLSLRRATSAVFLLLAAGVFLSTLSLRRATSQQPEGTTKTTYFYPRSPCGERRGKGSR